jgi:ADP-ribosylglycohydrolase
LRRLFAFVNLFFLTALLVSAEPITAITGYFRNAAMQSGGDISTVGIIFGAIAGLFKGWIGFITGLLLGVFVAIIIKNADRITAAGQSVSMQ